MTDSLHYQVSVKVWGHSRRGLAVLFWWCGNRHAITLPLCSEVSSLIRCSCILWLPLLWTVNSLITLLILNTSVGFSKAVLLLSVRLLLGFNVHTCGAEREPTFPLKCLELIIASTWGVFLTLLASLFIMQLSLLCTLDLLLNHHLYETYETFLFVFCIFQITLHSFCRSGSFTFLKCEKHKT